MASAFPALARSARHQLGDDVSIIDWRATHLYLWNDLRPNLLVLTGVRCTDACARDCDEHSGMLLPMLMVREG